MQQLKSKAGPPGVIEMEMFPKLRFAMALVGVAAIASVLLPWVQQDGFSLSGTERGGVPVLLFGAAALTAALIGVDNRASRWLLSVGALISGLASGAGLWDVTRLVGSDSPIGVGLIVAVVVSTAATLGVIVMWLTLWHPSRANPPGKDI